MGNQSLVGDNRVNVQGSDDLWKVEKVEEDESFCEFTCTKKGVIEVERCKSAVKVHSIKPHPFTVYLYIHTDIACSSTSKHFEVLIITGIF